MILSQIQPVILSCDRTASGVTTKFTASYRRMREPLSFAWRNPVVCVDLTSSACLTGSYVQSLASLWPKQVVMHPPEQDQPACSSPDQAAYDSIQAAAHLAMRSVWGYVQTRVEDLRYVLWMEDDIEFSSVFARRLGEFAWPPGAGMVSLYRPGHGHDEGSGGRIPVDCFYGTQAVLFSFDAMRIIVEKEAEMLANWPPGYDIQWSRHLNAHGLGLHQTPTSLVQHIGVESKMHPDRFHQSEVFEA